MNVAIIIQSLTGGGAERVAKLLGDSYVKEGHSVYYFLTNNKAVNVYEVSGEKVFTNCLYYDYLCKKTICDIWQSVNKIRTLKKKLQIDVAISFMEWCNFLNVLSRGGEKTICSVRTALSARNELSGWIYNKKTIWLIGLLSDLMITPSEWQKNDLIKKYGISKRKLLVIPNPAVVRQVKSEEKWLYGKKAIVCVGRLESVKQHDRIIRAFSYAYKKDKDARLVLLGEGNTYNYLKMICRKQEVEDAVVFTGFTLDIGNYLSNARALVIASKAEGFPNVVVEAMAYGVPIITTDSPGGCGEIVGKVQAKNEIQHCEYGILTPYIRGKAPKKTELELNEVRLGKAILEIIENDDVFEKYSKQSIKRSADYNFDEIVSKWNGLIEEFKR